MIQEQFCWKLFLFPVAEGIAESKKLLFLLMSDRPRLGFLWLDRKRMGWREIMNHATLHCTDRLKMYITGFMGVNPLPYFILILLSLLDSSSYHGLLHILFAIVPFPWLFRLWTCKLIGNFAFTAFP